MPVQIGVPPSCWGNTKRAVGHKCMLIQVVAIVSAVALYYVIPEAYIHSRIKGFTTRSATNKYFVPNMKWVELKTSNSILPRSSHGVSIVNVEGKNMLVVYGGENIARTPLDSKVNVLEIDENREELSWTEAKPSDGENIPEPRVAHAQASIGTKVYIFGGRQSITMDEAPLNDLYSYDLATKTWENISVPSSGSVPSPRSFHKMVSVGKKLYVFGGCGANGRMADLHCYDVETKAWTALPTGDGQIAGRGGAGFMASTDGKYLFVVGGFAGKEMNDVYRYDIEAQTMSTIYEQDDDQATNPLRPFSVSCGGVLHGLIHYFGGEVNPSQKGHEGAGGFSNKVQVLNGVTGKVESKAAEVSGPAPRDRGWTDAAVLHENDEEKLVVFGGLSGDDSDPLRLNDVWVLEK